MILTKDYLATINLSAYRLAKDLGISDGNLAHVIKGRACPRLSLARKIAKRLNVSLDDITFLAELDEANNSPVAGL